MRVSKEVFGDEIRIIRIIESFVQYMIRKTNQIALCLLKLTNYRELTKYPGTNYTEFTVKSKAKIFVSYHKSLSHKLYDDLQHP